MSLSKFSRCAGSTAAIVLASSLLVSCGDDEKNAPSTVTPPAEAVEAPAPAPEVSPQSDAAAAKDALFDAMLYQAVAKMGAYARQPYLTETVRATLDLMQQYYDALPADEANSMERTKLALIIGDICRELTAYTRAGSMYSNALASFETLPAEEQNRLEMQFKKSSIYNGIASCMLMTPTTRVEAASYYKKQLDLDKAIYDSLVPEGQVPSITPDISTAASNLVSSYRCMGDCLVITDEMEDARDVYKKAVQLGTVLTSRSVPMMLEFIKLYTALGDLENKCGNDLPAAQAWATAATSCQKLFEKTTDQATKLECKRYVERLTPLLQEKSAILKAANPEAAAPAADAAPLN